MSLKNDYDTHGTVRLLEFV